MSAKKLTYGGVLLAVAVLLPQAFHLAAGPSAGMMLLPMHLPVLLGGFLLGPGMGAAIGFAAPLISSFLTGMPAPDRLVFMLFELAAYGFAAGTFYFSLGLRKKGLAGIYASLLLSMLAGRLFFAAALYAAALILGIPNGGIAAVAASAVTGVYGIILQLIAVPLIVFALERSGLIDRAVGSRPKT